MFREPDGDDDAAVAKAIDEVAAAFDAAHRPAERAWMVQQLLQMKHTYLDCTLFTWSREAVAELFTEVFPRKVVVDHGDPPLIAAGLGDLLVWMDDLGVLRPRGQGRALASYARGLAGAFTDAMADEDRWGMGKRLIGGWADDGLDVTDRSQLDEAMARFNALPFAERDRILGGALPSASPSLPPVVLAPPAELEAAARSAITFERVRRFAAYVADGRTLTDKRNLRLADGRELVELLETGDVVDPAFGDHTFRTRSTSHLTGVEFVFRLAVAARFARVVKGRVVATKSRATSFDTDGLDAWQALFTALTLELGPTALRRGQSRYGNRWRGEFVDEELPGLLAALYARDEVPFDELAERLWEELDDAYDLDSMTEDGIEMTRYGLRYDLGYALERFEDLGAVDLDSVTEEKRFPSGYVDQRRVITSVRLTALGTWAVQQLVSGYAGAPVVGAMSDLPVGELLATAPDLPEDLAAGELDEWLRRHSPAELVAGLTTAGSAGRALAFRALLRLGPSAEPAIALLDDEPALAPYGVVWRVDAGLAAAEEVLAPDAAGLVALLGAVLDLWGAPPVGHWLGLAAGIRVQEMVGEAWRVPSEHTEPVLAAIAGVADKAVAKEARKALFKLRSSGSH